MPLVSALSTFVAEALPRPPLAQLPIPPLAIWPDLTAVCLFSLLGVALSALVLSWVSSETISVIFSYTG
jgi:hypothetical protein